MDSQAADSLEAVFNTITEPTQAEPTVQTEQPVQQQVQTPTPPAPDPQVSQQPRTVPLPELMEERHKRQLAEREREASRRELAIYQQFLEAQRQAQQQPPIDPVTDPEGAWHALKREQQEIARTLQEQAIHQRANMSEMLARREHGDAFIDEARDAAIQAGLNRNFMNQPDPYAALAQWYRSQKVASEVGTDLTAFLEKKKQEWLREQSVQAKIGSAQAPQNLPPSLSTAARAGVPNTQVMDTGDFFKTMFAKRSTG